jgi:hypothetical protein
VQPAGPPDPNIWHAIHFRNGASRVALDEIEEKTAEAVKYDAFGPNHGGGFRPFDCGRTAGRFTVRANTAAGPAPITKHTLQNGHSKKDVPTPIRPPKR